MRKKWKARVFIILTVCAALAAGAGAFLCPAGGAEDTLLGERDGWAVRRGVPAIYNHPVTVTREQWLRGALMLCSPASPLPEDYPAPDVRAVRAVAGNYVPAAEDVALRPEVIYALCRLETERSLRGEAEIVGGTVSCAQQEAKQKDAFARYAAVYPLEEAIQRAAAAVPGGGETEHRTGYAVDIALCGALRLREENPLCRNETGKWLVEQMWRFGFIQRYAPGGGEDGACERVHLRYVGDIHACAMHALNLRLEAYLLLLHREKALTIYRDGAPWACVLCVPEAQAVTFQTPENAVPEYSGDNAGYVIAAFLCP